MKTIKKHFSYVIIFIIFAIILFLSPISGDDWGNFLVGKQGIYHAIGNAIGMYFDWEGRFVSRVLINILTYHKIIWNLLNSLIIVLIIYYSVKIINPRNKKLVFSLTLLTILLMNIYTFSEIILWIAANITYLFPLPLLLYYFYKIITQKDNKKIDIIILTMLNLTIPMFVEHVAGVLIIFNIFINLYSIFKYKKLNKKHLIYLIFSILGTTIMFMSPGNIKRASTENIEFNNLSLLGKISYNIPNFIYYTFLINNHMIIIMTIANYYLIKNTIKSKKIKRISFLYLIIIPLIILIMHVLSNFIANPILNKINQYNIFITIYYMSYIIIDFILMFQFLHKNKSRNHLLFYVLGIIANSIMLLSPTWGYRTSFLSYLLLTLSFIIIIDHCSNETKTINNLLLITSIGAFLFYILLYTNVYLAQVDREKSIKKQLNNDIIYIEKFPNFVNCNINPENEYHLQKFKEYYNIDQNKEIKLTKGNWKYKILYIKD